jgi:hypothetical protein
MPSSRIRPLDFNHGLEDVEPFQQEVDRPRLPPSELLQPSIQGPASPIEELIKARSFGDALDSSIRPAINDLRICRPEHYGRLLAEAREIVGEAGERSGDPDIAGLGAVLDHQGELRDLLGYYLQSLLNA